jgi:hypothetical protein
MPATYLDYKEPSSHIHNSSSDTIASDTIASHRCPGALHHAICRGIERRKICLEDSDRDDFLKRLETILGETQTPCYP